MNTRPVLSVQNVTKRFGGLVAVNDMSFQVGNHEMVGVIGPNGSGKTTVMNMISGSFKPTAGRISMKDRRLSDMPPQKIARAGVGRTFQLVRLLHEWLAGLNPTELDTGIELIHALRDEGRTVVLVEHVMDAIRSLCDRCVVMSSGAKIAEGSPDDVLSDREVIRAYLGDDDA